MTRAAPYGSAAWRAWKHDHHWATGGTQLDPLGAGNTALIAALGGSSVVLGFWDVRENVTVATGVSNWADVSGAGTYGPAFVQATGTKQPAWDAVNLLITPNGSTQNMMTAANAIFDPSLALTLVFVGAIPSGAPGSTAVAQGTAGASNGAIGSLGATNIFTKMAGTNLSTTAAAGTTRRIVFASKIAGTSSFAEAPTTAQQTTTIVNPGSSSANQLALGALVSGSTFGACPTRAVLFLRGAYTTTQRDALKTWAVTYHGVTLF